MRSSAVTHIDNPTSSGGYFIHVYYCALIFIVINHAFVFLIDEEYVRRQLREAQEEAGESMKSLRWDGASLRKVTYTTTLIIYPMLFFIPQTQ